MHNNIKFNKLRCNKIKSNQSNQIESLNIYIIIIN